MNELKYDKTKAKSINKQIDKLLREFLTLPKDSPQWPGLKADLQKWIYDPALVEKSPMVPEKSPLKIEAQIISDAFESVTNGMYNPEAMAALDHISEESLFTPWKCLILAIRAYYNGDFAFVKTMIDQIPAETGPAALTFTLTYLTENRDERELTEAESYLKNHIIVDNPLIISAQEQLRESIENGLEDVFLNTSTLLIKEVSHHSQNAALRTAIWCIHEASEHEFSLGSLMANFRSLFGQGETQRLVAIALQDEDPDLSLLFWLRAMITRLQDGSITLEEVTAYLNIIAQLTDMVQVIQEKEPEFLDEDYFDGLKGLLHALTTSLNREFPVEFEGDWNSNDLGTLYLLGKRAEEKSGPAVKAPEECLENVKQTKNHRSKNRQKKKKQPIQLELF